MKISDLSLNALRAFVTGDGSPTPYLSGPELIKFFNAFGLSDEYTRQGLPNSWSRNEYALERLKSLNGKIEFKSLVEALCDSRKVNNPDDVAREIGEIIKHDGYTLTQNELGIFKVSGSGLEDPVLVESHFQEIKSQIIDSLRDAKFTIWIAMAWFTDKDIGTVLLMKHRSSSVLKPVQQR